MLVYGRNVVREILNSNTKVYKVFLDNNFQDNEYAVWHPAVSYSVFPPFCDSSFHHKGQGR